MAAEASTNLEMSRITTEQLGLNMPPPGLTTAVFSDARILLVSRGTAAVRCPCPGDQPFQLGARPNFEVVEVRLEHWRWLFTRSDYLYGICKECGTLFLWPDADMREQMELAGWHLDDLAPSALSGFREGRPSQPRLLEVIG
jgi:hypothetical protein